MIEINQEKRVVECYEYLIGGIGARKRQTIPESLKNLAKVYGMLKIISNPTVEFVDRTNYLCQYLDHFGRNKDILSFKEELLTHNESLYPVFEPLHDEEKRTKSFFEENYPSPSKVANYSELYQKHLDALAEVNSSIMKQVDERNEKFMNEAIKKYI
jgi:hypothetical protein